MPHELEETLNVEPLRRELSDTALTTPLPAPCNLVSPEACIVQIHPTGANLGRRYSLSSEPLLVGRELTCGISLSDNSVSRTHAQIELKSDRCFHISDLNSTNGTFVNNVRVRTVPLEDGDYLRIGPCIYRFLAGGNVEAEYHEELHRLTVLDPLTGVHNRRSLMECLDREVERSRRYHHPLSVLLLDVDHFKTINDQFGHLAGDFTLKDLAIRLVELTRKHEMLARYGGEEFMVVLPETDLAQAIRCGERFRKAIAAKPFVFEGNSIAVTVSAGVGCLGVGEAATTSDLLKRADSRLYEAKRAGRNRVVPTARVGRFGPLSVSSDSDPTSKLFEATDICRDHATLPPVQLPSSEEQ